MAVKTAELQKFDNYHFIMTGYTTFSEVLKKLKKAMQYYRFEEVPKMKITEVFYDNEHNMLSDAGVVLSKSTTNKDTFFNIRRLSRVLNKKTKKYHIGGNCRASDHPREYAQKIATAIDNLFSSSLTIDIENIVKKTKEIIEVEINKIPYNLICGTGFRAKLVCEQVVYKDVETGRKVYQDCVSLNVPSGEYEETAEILQLIESTLPSLVLFNASRFELACKLLYTQPQQFQEEEDEEEN